MIGESIMARKRKLPVSKNALCASLAAIAFGVLVVGTRLFVANVVKKHPTTQSYHLIGFAFIWLIAVLSFLTFLCVAWRLFYLLPDEERLAHPSLRKVTFGLLLLALAFIAFEVSRIVIR